MARIVVGLSGGVDSSLVAALLKERGYDVVGVYLKIEPSAVSRQPLALCPWREDIEMCRRVAAHLDIPLHIIDASAEYHASVVQPFIEAYARGETPNPDILCNRWVKFDLLMREARAIDAEKIATGHYARVVYPTPSSSPSQGEGEKNKNFPTSLREGGRGGVGSCELHRGVDPVKDQSYFLWMLTQEQLAITEFPLGEWKKDDVREEAHRRNLPNWDRRSSRGVCFLGPFDIPAFIREHTIPVTADVVTTAGEHIGTTTDAHTLTIGQRVGLGGQPTSRYVVAKDMGRKVIIVSDEPSDPARVVSLFEIGEPHWIGEPPRLPFTCDVRIRHRQKPVSCIIFSPSRPKGERDGVWLCVELKAPLTGVAPGQAAVFSTGDRVLGGAWITVSGTLRDSA